MEIAAHRTLAVSMKSVFDQARNAVRLAPEYAVMSTLVLEVTRCHLSETKYTPNCRVSRLKAVVLKAVVSSNRRSKAAAPKI